MRRTLIFISLVAIVLAGAIRAGHVLGRNERATQLPIVAIATPKFKTISQLPIVFRAASTPTPTASPTPTVTPTSPPTLTTTPTTTPKPQPTSDPSNIIRNGSFEEGWDDLPPEPGFLINQQPKSWKLTWLKIGEPIWDDATAKAEGVPEALHKLKAQLPPEEWPDGSRPLILEGEATYKIFHFAASFGGELYQVVEGLPGGTSWRLSVPIQAHLQGDTDPWAAESGAWAITSADQAGGWVIGGVMGDRTWFHHQIEFTVPADGRVGVLIRVKSKWQRAKDFFIDDVRLTQTGSQRTTSWESAKAGIMIEENGRLWLPRPLDKLPEREKVFPIE